MTNQLLKSVQPTLDTLHFAFEYLDRGWPVIPVDGKTPATAWSAYQKELPSTKQVRRWFSSGGRKNYNLAIVTGHYSGLVVVDCDSPQAAKWWQGHFPETPLAVCTGGGGMHFYYRYPDEHIACRTRVLGRQIDIRGEGGLAIAPASVHPETGQSYQWQELTHYSLDEVPFFDSSWIAEPQKAGIFDLVAAPCMPEQPGHSKRDRLHSSYCGRRRKWWTHCDLSSSMQASRLGTYRIRSTRGTLAVERDKRFAALD